VQVDADLASAWTPYSFYLDGRLRHCGVDSIELLCVEGAWKITQLSDTQRTQGCRELPAGGRGEAEGAAHASEQNPNPGALPGNSRGPRGIMTGG